MGIQMYLHIHVHYMYNRVKWQRACLLLVCAQQFCVDTISEHSRPRSGGQGGVEEKETSVAACSLRERERGDNEGEEK